MATDHNIEALTASLEQSFQMFSLGISDDQDGSLTTSNSVDLNSQISLPCHWEQCLDFKTGEVCYINWKSGSKVRKNPRMVTKYGYYCSQEEGSKTYESEKSSPESSPEVKMGQFRRDHVLVVAGCKICLMYIMVPKKVRDCPKCSAHLLHFDGSSTS